MITLFSEFLLLNMELLYISSPFSFFYLLPHPLIINLSFGELAGEREPPDFVYVTISHNFSVYMLENLGDLVVDWGSDSWFLGFEKFRVGELFRIGAPLSGVDLRR